MNDRRPHGRPRWLVAVTLALVAACTGSPGGSATDGTRGQGGSEASTTAPESGVSAEEHVAAAVDTYLEGDLTGASEDVRAVLVTVGGRPVLERYYDSSAEATSGVFSVTKSVMSILVGIALDEGDLGSVEQTLAKLLPEYAATMAPEVAGVTLRQVLTMTAGLPQDTAGSDPLPFETADDWIAAIVSGGLVRPPGEDFAYASAGSHLLSAILVEATGRSVLDYAREKLFDPLGISTDPAAEPLAVIENLPVYEAASFAWPVDPQGVHLGHTYLKINAPDMAKIGQLMLDDGRWDGEQIVSTQWVTESTRAQVATSGGSTGDYGYQWWVTTANGLDAFAAVGFGGQLIEVVPDLRLVVVVSNTVPDVPRLTSASFIALVDQLIAPAVTP
jgi:CubicO group peptidase (beta-lactamase class C family)